ncbi:MAG TPA: P27 family phage terminase small subunit [Ohtaekwangia sp.]|nr:P27 family phage terminase small subunit [Ohtaekwangia sp.]
MDFLSKNGLLVFEEIQKHCRSKFKMYDVDKFEMAMLANSFDLYSESAKVCNEKGVSMSFMNDKGGIYEQIRPEYTVMKNEYGNILKHSGKFGLNPGDRDKIFKGLKDEKKKKGFDTDNKMKVA